MAALTLLCAGTIPSASAACPGEDLAPLQLSVQEARESVACLINEQRALSGLGPLTANVSLQQAAQHHSKKMNKQNVFAHGSALNRIKRAGYGRGASRWGVGEVIGWGTGQGGSPKSLISAWMASPTHRPTLLMPNFEELGVGVVKGSPRSRGRRPKSAIYTVDFGYRR